MVFRRRGFKADVYELGIVSFYFLIVFRIVGFVFFI